MLQSEKFWRFLRTSLRRRRTCDSNLEGTPYSSGGIGFPNDLLLSGTASGAAWATETPTAPAARAPLTRPPERCRKVRRPASSRLSCEGWTGAVTAAGMGSLSTMMPGGKPFLKDMGTSFWPIHLQDPLHGLLICVQVVIASCPQPFKNDNFYGRIRAIYARWPQSRRRIPYCAVNHRAWPPGSRFRRAAVPGS